MPGYKYLKSDLLYTYKEKAKESNDNPYITGKIDRDKFNRHEEYEVLTLINSYSEKNNLSYDNCRKMEILINKHLPSDIINREEINKWFDENINKYTLQK